MKGLIVKEKATIEPVIEMEYNLEKPTPAEGEVLIKVHSASVNPYDLESAAGEYDNYFEEYGFDKPVQTGLEFSGTVETQGNQFEKGDRIFGYVHLITGWKAHAEYITVPESYVAPIPPSLTFEQAAALPLGILTSLAVYEDLAPKKANLNILIVGASGGIGVYAIQIAQIFNHRTTVLASKGHADFMRTLGADKAYEYNAVKVSDLKDKFDLILDLSTRLTLKQCQSLLSPEGKFVPALPNEENGGTSAQEQVGYLMVMHGDGTKLAAMTKSIEAQHLVPVIEESYRFDEYTKALAHLTQKGKRGRIIMTW